MHIALSIIHGNNSYYRVISSNETITIGASVSSTIHVPGLKKRMEIRWSESDAAVKIIQGMTSNSVKVPFDHIKVLDEEEKLAIYFVQSGSCQYEVSLPSTGDICIGRTDKRDATGHMNDIQIGVKYISRYHLTIACSRGNVSVFDCGSKNGLFLNGSRITSASLKDGDILSVYTVQILLSGGKLIFQNVDDKFTVLKTQRSEPPKGPTGPKIAPFSHDMKTSFRHIRSPHLVSTVAPEIINIEKPPQQNAAPQFNWLYILLPPIVSIALMVVLVLAMGMSPFMLIMSGVMSLVSVFLAITNYNKQKKEYADSSANIDGKYAEYLDGIAQKVFSAKAKQLKALKSANPTPNECLKIAQTRSQQLWDRTPSDSDFASVSLGTGRIASAVTAKIQQNQFVLQENPLENKARELADASCFIDKAPIVCNFSSGTQLGLIGHRTREIQLARNIIVELSAAHSYDELKIVALVPEGELGQWSWLRWLPHCSDNAKIKRYIFTSPANAKDGLDKIEAELKGRSDSANNYSTNSLLPYPHYVFIVAARGLLENHPIWNYVVTSNPSLGCSALFLYDHTKLLPKECTRIIDVTYENGEVYETSNTSNRTHFQMESFSLEDADKFARALAPVYTDISEAADTSLTKSISFMKGYGVSRPAQLNISERWANAQTFKSLSVPIGALPGGGIFSFDVHEKQHGVMGVVAGMPGSGKTEMVQSWLLSLAANFSPEDINFVLIDFKGSSLIAPFRNLPHLAGSISNLDVPNGIDRNLVALRSELERRESLLDSYSKKLGKSKFEVNDLNKMHAQGLVPDKLPILIVAIDEYAEFKKQFPDFGAEIDSITSKGRGLGMFVVLMSQTLSGVLSPKSEQNIRYTWGLRVANNSASQALLGTLDAAAINNIGRAYVKVGENELYQQVQSFWSNAPYNPDALEKKGNDSIIAHIDILGNRKKHEASRSERKCVENDTTESSEIVNFIATYCKSNGIKSARKIWSEALPNRIALNRLLKSSFNGQQWPYVEKTAPVVGLLDDPAGQTQYPLLLDFANCGHTVIYGAPVTGKTTLLQTLVVSLAATRRPDQVSIYAMDFGGWNLNFLKDFPHVGGIANDNQPERLKKLAMLLLDTLSSRKAKFSSVGVGNINAYREATREQIPDIVLVVDNFAPVLKLYPELDDFFITLSSGGANYGIYLVITASATNAVPLKIAQNFKNAIALQLLDKSDYTYTVGRVTELVPPIPGRGYAKGNPPLAFQAALPAPGETDKEVADNIRSLMLEMNRSWSGETPAVIPELPEHIPYGSIKAKLPALGLSTEKVSPVCYDHSAQHYLLISGTTRSGKSNMLTVLSRQLKERYGGVPYLFDVNEKLPHTAKMYSGQCLSVGTEIDAFFEKLVPELQRRQTDKKANPALSFSPIIIAVDDYTSFHKIVSNDTVARLTAIAKIGAGLGLYLLVSADSYELSSFVNKGEAVCFFLAKGQQAIMLGGCINDHSAIPTKVAYSQKSVTVNAHEGFYVMNGEATRFKAMSSQEV